METVVFLLCTPDKLVPSLASLVHVLAFLGSQDWPFPSSQEGPLPQSLRVCPYFGSSWFSIPPQEKKLSGSKSGVQKDTKQMGSMRRGGRSSGERPGSPRCSGDPFL